MTYAYRPSTASSFGRTTSYSHAGSFQHPKVYYMMDYLPSRYSASYAQQQDREAIYNFKDGYCGSRIIDGLASAVRRFADSNTVVCFVPASTHTKTERRYGSVAAKLNQKTGVRCSYEAIEKTTDSESGHIGGKSSDPAADFTFRSGFFSGKKVILIDDVITRGTTLEGTARRLRNLGAREVVCIAVGKTTNPDWNGGENRNVERL